MAIGKIRQQAINWAIAVAKNDRHGYSQAARTGPDYDCSSFVYFAYTSNGLPVGDPAPDSSKIYGGGYSFLANHCYGYPTATFGMVNNYTNAGFIWIPKDRVTTLIPGDIFLDEDRHTALFIGVGKENWAGYGNSAAAHGTYGHPEAGDQSSREISVYTDNIGPYDGILRLPDTIDPPGVWPVKWVGD